MEQIIRPTGIPDPVIEIVPSKNQIDHLVNEIQQRIDLRERTLVTTLTKRMAEEISKYLSLIHISSGFRNHASIVVSAFRKTPSRQGSP